MANLLNPFSDETANPSSVPCVVPRISLSMITTAVTASIRAKSADRPSRLVCPHCGHSLSRKKQRKQFILHKCINPKCPYYLHNLKKVDNAHLNEAYGKNKYKLHYIYWEFTIDFFRMDLNSLPKHASSLRFSKHNAHVMSLCLTLHINLGLSLRKTSQALKDLYNIRISHQQIANYCKTAAVCIKPFVDHYPYEKGNTFIADETYIKVRKVKTYVWLIMNAACRSIIGYQVSDNRGVGPCILAMRMAFLGLKKLPENFKFIADGYSAYPLAAMEFAKKFGKNFTFSITPVIGLTNDDAVSKKYRPFKQIVERLNRTYKASYRKTNDFDNIQGLAMTWLSRLLITTSCAHTNIRNTTFSMKWNCCRVPITCLANGSCSSSSDNRLS